MPYNLDAFITSKYKAFFSLFKTLYKLLRLAKRLLSIYRVPGPSSLKLLKSKDYLSLAIKLETSRI